jgi:hypothetical protein
MRSMQAEYLARLQEAVQAFVHEVEDCAGVTIEVTPDADLNTGGPTGQGKLKIHIEAHCVRLMAPTNVYFPNGGVRHEVLHVKRLLVDGVPRLALAETVDWDPFFEKELTAVDNALEHLVIVPVELGYHPERRAHWEAVMARTWNVGLSTAPSQLDRRISACLHWTFLRHVLPDSPLVDSAIAAMEAFDLRAEADDFCDQLIPLLADKLSVVQLFFKWFGNIPKDRAAVEYLNCITGTTQSPIPP